MSRHLDKVAHFLLGLIVGLVAYWVIGVWSLLLVGLIAVAKEAWDCVDDETTRDVELADLIATILGGVTATFLWIISGWIVW